MLSFSLYADMAMKKLLSIMAISSLVLGTVMPTLTFAQTNDQVVGDLLASSWWYTDADKSSVKVIAKTDTTATLEAPVAKKNGETVQDYYILWSPISYATMMSNSNADDLIKSKDSTKAALAAWGTPIYKVEGEKVIFTIDIAEPTQDIYVTLVPEGADKVSGNGIYDYAFNLSTVQVASANTTAVAGDTHNPAMNQAITNVTCVWDATANRTTLLWDINTGLSATSVEISHRGDEKQGDMAVKGKPNITDRKFVVDTPHRNVQLFRLKPLDGAGTMVGNEIQYICKNDTPKTPDTTTPVKPTNPKKPIPVTPATGPAETAAVVLVLSLLIYGLYRKLRKA